MMDSLILQSPHDEQNDNYPQYASYVHEPLDSWQYTTSVFI